jgi:transcriptional regulator with XRE-family HTH domain
MDNRPLLELRRFRETQKPPISQRELAEDLGVTRVTVARWEMGLRAPDRKLLPAITKRTGLTATELLGLTEQS